MTEISIRDQWDRLPAPVTQWLLANPGCMILPRTISAEISAATDQGTNGDPHGETALSQEDVDFIQMKSHEAEAGLADPDHKFFDSVQP